MHRFLVPPLAAFVALVLVSPGGAARIAPTPKLPGGWSHAEINVIVKKVPHTLVYDRGRILSFTSTSLTLREADRSIQVIPVSPASRVTIDGRPAKLSQLRRLEIAITLRIDGADATRVTVRVPPRLAARIAARQARARGHRS